MPEPRLRAAVYTNPHVVTVGLVYGIVGLTYIVQSIFMYSFALDAGVPAVDAGRMVSSMGILSIFAGPAWGWASDRIGRSNGLVLCMTLSLLGTLLPVLWPVTLAFALHYLLLGISVTGLFTSILAASTETVHPRHAPVAVSFVTLFFALGQLFGPAAAGVLIETTGGFRSTFATTCVLMLLGIVLCRHTAHAQRRVFQNQASI